MATHQSEQTPLQSQSLSLATLSELADGQAEATINAAIAAAIRDTEDRGGDDEKERKVVIEIGFRKLGDDAITATIKAKTTIPPYLTKPTVGRIVFDGRRPEMKFSPASADNPGQRTIVDAMDAADPE